MMQGEIGTATAHECPDACFLFFTGVRVALDHHEALLLPPLQQALFPLEIRSVRLLFEFYGFFKR